MNSSNIGTTKLSLTKLFEILEKGFVVLALLLYAGAVLQLVRLQGVGGELSVDVLSGDPLLRYSYIAIYVITFFLLLQRWQGFIYFATRDKLLLLLVGIAVVSVFWSVQPDVTLPRSAALLGTTLFGVYLATRFSLREQLLLVAWTLGISVLASLLFIVALPSYAEFADFRGSAIRGAFIHKNSLGRVMALAAMVFLLFFLSDRRYRWVTGVGFGLSVGLLLLSRSATALVVFLVLLFLLPLYKGLRWRYGSLVPVLIAGVGLCGGIVMWLSGSEQNALSTVGRDVTLTGRTQLWAAVLDMIWQHPWLGYGYGAFWLGWQGEAAHIGLALIYPQYVNPISGIPPHAHNGFLDLWLDLGLLGLSVFALGFLLAVSRALAWLKSSNAAEGYWPLVYLSFALLFSMTESTTLRLNSMFWVLYVSTLLSTFVKPAKLPNGSPFRQPTNVDKVGALNRTRQSSPNMR